MFVNGTKSNEQGCRRNTGLQVQAGTNEVEWCPANCALLSLAVTSLVVTCLAVTFKAHEFKAHKQRHHVGNY